MRSTILVAFALLAACGSEHRPSATTLEARLEAARVAADAPAMAAAVVTDDGVTTAATGVRRLGGEAVAPDDAFHLGSLAKSMTALVAASLVRDRVIDWTTSIDAVWPEAAAAGRSEYRAVTLAQLLQHRSGLPGFELFADLDSVPTFEGDAKAQRRSFAAWLLEQEPIGTNEFNYSNAGYAVAAAMLEERSGLSWEQLVDERVFAPLALATAGVGWPRAARSDAPWGHIESDAGLAPYDDSATPFPSLLAPAGDVHMSVGDLGRYAQLHLRGLLGESDIYPASMVASLHTSDYPAIVQGVTYAFGWLNTDEPAGPVTGHDGSADTYYAVVRILPGSRRAAVVLANAATDRVVSSAETLAELLTGDE